MKLITSTYYYEANIGSVDSLYAIPKTHKTLVQESSLLLRKMEGQFIHLVTESTCAPAGQTNIMRSKFIDLYYY